MPEDQWETIRSSVEYEAIVVGRALDEGGVIFGVITDIAPQNFHELKEIVEAKRNPSCGISEEIDEFVHVIAQLPERDEAVRLLPFHDNNLAFVIPSPETLKQIRQNLKP